jgi:hypothetical protein
VTSFLLAASLLAVSLPARAETEPPRTVPSGVVKVVESKKRKDGTPAILKVLIKPIKRGMLVRLPIIDTDPNRGSTVGVMPIWVIQEDNSDRIKFIHAPSLTYNGIFSWIPTYRFYAYPTDDSSVILRGSLSTQEERELLGHFEDSDLFGRGISFNLKTQFNVDGAKRFYGFGPDSPKSAEANYIEDYLLFRVSGGIPLRDDSKWKIHAGDSLLAMKVKNGRTPNLTTFRTTFPGVGPFNRQQTQEMTLRVGYDSRDHGVTTSKGAYLDTYMGTSVRGFASAHDFQRYGMDGRIYHKWPDRKQVTAAQLRYEQVLADAPFWLQPSLGGKDSLRAYGEGRYVDRGAVSFNVEQRFTVFDVKMAGVTTEFELAPFAGLGAVADNPGRFSRRYARPVFGLATRAVAKPQVVGSLDFGYGQEGLAAFIDINYSF